MMWSTEKWVQFQNWKPIVWKTGSFSCKPVFWDV